MMRWRDLIQLAIGAVIAHRLRSLLTALGIAVGIAAVVMLTAIGSGIHQFVLSEFTQFGTNLISITPGKVTTHGGSVGAFGTDRPLTIDDAQALQRIADIVATEPIMAGNAVVKSNGRERRTNVYGVGPHFPNVFTIGVASGRFLPPDEPHAARAFAVLGSKLQDELFGAANPIGQRISIGGETFRIIGVMHSKGQVLGFDIDDTIYIPAAKSLEMFNRDSLMEIDILYRAGADANTVAARIKELLIARHGKEDFTVTTQQQMLDVLDKVLGVLTFAVAALGGISLVVGGVGILTIMTIAVRERTAEIGLLRALGAQRRHVLLLFLGEATVLSALGGAFGMVVGIGGAQLLHLAVPALPVKIAWDYVVIAEMIAALIGMVAGVMPARRAARLDPVEALRAE